MDNIGNLVITSRYDAENDLLDKQKGAIFEYFLVKKIMKASLISTLKNKKIYIYSYF